MFESINLEFRSQRLPSLLQTEAAECGLACLAMIASYHGFRTDLPSLRGRFSLSLNGANMMQILDYASRLKLGGRAVRAELHEIPDLRTPCILHWDMNHFVVLKSANTKGIVVHDPAVGVRHLKYGDVDNHFTGVALELTPATDFAPADERRKIALSALLGSVSGAWQGFALVFVMALALQSFALLSPMLNQWIVDEALVTADRSLLNVLAFGSFLLLVTQVAIGQARDWTLLYLSTHLNLQWTGNVFSHLLRLPVSWFEKRHLGDVVSRFGSAGAIQQTITTSAVAAVLDGLMAIATFVMMMFYSTALSLIVIGSVLAYVLIRFVSYRPLREASAEALALSAREQSCFLETIRAIQAIKLFGRELDRQSRWMNLKVNAVNRIIRTQKLNLWFGSINAAVAGIAGTMMFWLGGSMVMDGVFTIGMLFAFTSYGSQFGARMAALIDVFFEFRMLSLHAERLADIVLELAESDMPYDASIAHLEARIELVDVGFKYSDDAPWVMRHVNLVIEPGDAIAIIGPSGGGKTTLIKLILSMLHPTEGDILYGGVSIKQIGGRAYRAALAVVMQDDQLLAGSIAENISFFEKPIDKERISECARLAAVNADIEAMPMRYETLIGDMGSALSGGQKQRILLARALYKTPKILVLDEATSHLDVNLERSVNAAVVALNITRIIVAHRPETIASARRVVALVNGSIGQDVTLPTASDLA